MEGIKKFTGSTEKLQNETQNPDRTKEHTAQLSHQHQQLDSTTATTRDCTPWLAPTIDQKELTFFQASLCTTPVLKPPVGTPSGLYQTHSSDVLKHRKEIQRDGQPKTRCPPFSSVFPSTCSHSTLNLVQSFFFFIKSFFFLILIFLFHR